MSEYREHPLRKITQRPGAKGDTRMSADAAGYMELAGAEKNADCHKVKVKDGVSEQLGCCNEFQPESDKVQEFRCGNCKFVRE